MSGRLPAHVEVTAIIRAAQAEGGFATVLSKGEPDAGTVALITHFRGGAAQLWERMPGLDDRREFVRTQASEDGAEFEAYLKRRQLQDPDCWFIELDIADAPQFVARLGT